MWPFKKKRPLAPTLPFAHDLNPAEVDWLHQQRDSLKTLSLAAGFPAPESDHTLEWADALVRWWHAQPPEERIHANLLAWPIAVVLGDALAAALGMQWKIVTDSHGADIALWWSPDGRTDGGAGTFALSPSRCIAQEFAKNPGGFIAALYDTLTFDALKLQQRAPAR